MVQMTTGQKRKKATKDEQINELKKTMFINRR